MALTRASLISKGRLLFYMSLLYQMAFGLIDEFVSQRTSITPYIPTLMDGHSYFDISFKDSSSLIQADRNATYHLSRLSSMSYQYFQFIRIDNADGTRSIIFQDLNLEGYLVFGMCKYGSTLDYVVAQHQNSNQVRILRILVMYGQATVIDYKVVDKDAPLVLQDNIYVDCKHTGTYRGVNTYTVGILGSYIESNSLTSYYLAKFSTKYNLTEYFVKSADQSVMEIPRAIRVDPAYKLIYIAVEINKNKYHNRTVYSPGDLPGLDNSNVAIIAYTWTHAVRQWVTVIGDKTYQDAFGDMEIYDGYLYAVTNSFTTKYSTNSSQTDIMYFKMRSENGNIEYNQTYGSPYDDRVLDMEISYNGVVLLSQINWPFLPHQNFQYQWRTQNSKQNLALILIDFSDLIMDIEAYDTSLTSVVNPTPIKFFVVRNTGVKQRFILISHRSNNLIDVKGGIYLTQINDPNALFAWNSGCASNCARCNPRALAKCLECNTGYFLYQHSCWATTCPVFTYPMKDESLTTIQYCKKCHHTCMNCLGPTSNECTTCCTNGVCGPTKDRTANLGICTCPAGMTESNGICNQKCQLNMAGKLGQMCYTQCPKNSFPELKYDQATAQERTQFDSSQTTSCDKYSSHLQFNKNGKGLPVFGPPNFQHLPSEFTISFWIYPIALNAQSVFINAFDRIFIKAFAATSKVYFQYMVSSSTYVEPTYPTAPNDVNQQLILGQWNYVSVSLREFKSGTVMKYEQQLAVAQSNFGSVMDAGYKNTNVVVNYNYFQNRIYIGANSDQNPQSFTGYLKEFKLLTKYHSFAQMQDEATRLHRLYSYDDPTLVAYWKLNEQFQANAIQYTINDYSINQNSFTYSIDASPDYPVFISDTSKALTICTFHDVAVCRSVEYSLTTPIMTSQKRLLTAPTLVLNDFSLVKGQSDQLWFLPNNTKCSEASQIMAKMNYTAAYGWTVPDSTQSPLDLQEGKHYQVCYYDASENIVFNLFQLYLSYKPRTIDPSNGSIYNRTDNKIQWMTGHGDQAYGDVIRFMEDCSTPLVNETEIIRSIAPDYQQVVIQGGFIRTGNFFFCWYPVFIQDYMAIPYFESIHDLKYLVQNQPALIPTFQTSAYTNQDMVMLNTIGTLQDGDQFAIAWRGVVYADCNPTNFLGETYIFNHSSWPGIWIGYDTGIHGILNSKMDEVQACWKPGAEQSPSTFIRLLKTDGAPFIMRIFDYLDTTAQRCPELQSFNPPYGSSVFYQNDQTIQFNFKAQMVYPAKYDGPPVQKGRLIIYRGAITDDGSVVKVGSEILWQNVNLDETTLPDPFQQDDLICTQTGQCSIILNDQSSRLKSGEVYYLSFFPFSFATINNGVKYYLFNNIPTPITQSAYDHLFFCRSFTIYPSQQLISGNTFTISGVDLKSKVRRAKYSLGMLSTDTFYTKAINLKLTVFNTDKVQCTAKRPVATVAMSDIYSDHFTVNNLVLRECDDGDLFADIEVVRGIKDQYGEFTYVRSEKMYNVQMGRIGCDQSCYACNGTTESNCFICKDPSAFLYMGKCLSQCPSVASVYTLESVEFQTLSFSQNTCAFKCPLGQYMDPQTSFCLACNADCQTCNSSLIASCLSCNPTKYLFNGLCVPSCPSPYHINNNTDYVCHQISQPTYLKVKILSLGYINKIQKDKTQFIKVEIDNTGGGNITSILWEQLEPDDVDMQVLTYSTVGNLTYQTVQLSTNALLKIPGNIAVKVKCTVNNTFGEVAYDIYEFYMNDPPNIGTTNISIVGDNDLSKASALNSIWHLSLANWYDKGDDLVQMLKLKVFMYLTTPLGLATVTTYYTITDQVSQNDIYLRLPLLSNNYTSQNLTICIGAEDVYQGVSNWCSTINYVSTSLDFVHNLTLLTNHLSTINVTANISNVLYTVQNMQMALPSPPRPNSQPRLCTLDYHCRFQGICSSKSGAPKCECSQGYFGTYCDFRQNELQSFKTMSKAMIKYVLNHMQTKYSISGFDIEVIANVVRGLTNHPDVVDDEDIENIILLMKFASSASIYSHQIVDINVTTVMLDAYSQTIAKIMHSKKLRSALKNTDLLGEGASLIDYTQSLATSGNNTGSVQKTSISTQRRMLSENQESIIQHSSISPLRSKQRRVLLSAGESDMFQDWSRRIDTSLQEFINHYMIKLDKRNNQTFYKSKTFELMVSQFYSNVYNGTTQYIRPKDAYWILPFNLFSDQQGRASRYQYVNQKVMKYIANPFQNELNQGAILESNVTLLEFYTLGNQRIPISLTNNSYIDYREPQSLIQNIDLEQIRCLAWDETNNTFINDNSCAYSQLFDILPCPDCDQYNYINVTVGSCRCKHLSRFGIVYAQTSPLSQATGVQVGIYTDFFAMKYWMESFGFYAVLGGMIFFFFGHIIFLIVDRRLQRNMIIMMKEKIKKFELKYGNSKIRNGLFLKTPDQMGLKSNAKRKTLSKMNQDDLVEGQKLIQDDLNDDTMKGPKEEYKTLSKKKLMNKKVYKQDQDLLNNDDHEDHKESAITSKPNKSQSEHLARIGIRALSLNEVNKHEKKQTYKDMFGADHVNDEFDEFMKMKLDAKHSKNVNKQEGGHQLKIDHETFLSKDVSLLDKRQQNNFQRHKTLLERLSDIQEVPKLYQELMTLKIDEVIGMTRREFKKLVSAHLKRLPIGNRGEIKEHFLELTVQLNSSDEELTLHLNYLFEQERIERETLIFQLKEMIISGNHILSLIFITSILSPRHIRFSLLFACICLNLLFCAVLFNNTKDPLEIPDFSRDAKNIAFDQLWVSAIAPFGTYLLMYIVGSFIKSTNTILMHCATSRQLDVAILEMKKEMRLRFILGYAILVVVFGTIFWYVVQFTASFGWKVSWTWWYAGIFAVGLQFVILDQVVTILHWLVFKVNKNLGRMCWRIRQVKQGFCEVYKDPFDNPKRKRKILVKKLKPKRLND